MTRPTPSTGDLDRIVNGEPRTLELAADVRGETLKDRISTWLSTVAMVVFAGGLGAGLWIDGVGSTGGWGPYALLPAAAMLGVMVGLSDSSRRPEPAAAPAAPPDRPHPPGPTDRGNLHTKGPGAKP